MLRPGFKPLARLAAATSSSVRNSLFALAAERSSGVSYNTNQVPCRFGSPHAVLGIEPDFAPDDLAAADFEADAGVWAVMEKTPTDTSAKALAMPATDIHNLRFIELLRSLPTR